MKIANIIKEVEDLFKILHKLSTITAEPIENFHKAMMRHLTISDSSSPEEKITSLRGIEKAISDFLKELSRPYPQCLLDVRDHALTLRSTLLDEELSKLANDIPSVAKDVLKKL